MSRTKNKSCITLTRRRKGRIKIRVTGRAAGALVDVMVGAADGLLAVLARGTRTAGALVDVGVGAVERRTLGGRCPGCRACISKDLLVATDAARPLCRPMTPTGGA